METVPILVSQRPDFRTSAPLAPYTQQKHGARILHFSKDTVCVFIFISDGEQGSCRGPLSWIVMARSVTTSLHNINEAHSSPLDELIQQRLFQ